jgi:hypothetical protein
LTDSCFSCYCGGFAVVSAASPLTLDAASDYIVNPLLNIPPSIIPPKTESADDLEL